MLFNWCALFEVGCFGGPSVEHCCQIGSVLSWMNSVSRGRWAGAVYCHNTAGILFFFLFGTILTSTWHLIFSFLIAMGKEGSSVDACAEVPSSVIIHGLCNAAA